MNEHPHYLAVILLPWLFVDCMCGVERLASVDQCAANPTHCQKPTVPIHPPTAAACATGNVSGRVCATDTKTWLNGVSVSVDAPDCNGAPVHEATTSAQGGVFTLSGVPTGAVTVHAALGSFSQDTPVTVVANQTTTIADDQLCVAQKATKIAVVTGAGDRIETLLDDLSLKYDLYDGTQDFAANAAPFLSDASRLSAYQIVFIDCAAGYHSAGIDLGASAAAITTSLDAYVSNGGALYASDWAALFAVIAAPDAFDFLTSTGAAVQNPLNTKILLGYAPQQLSGNVIDAGLAAFLGTSSVPILFPNQSGAESLHWGLLQDTQGSVLVEADGVFPCATEACKARGTGIARVPLAVSAQVGKGKVIYTSFHNIAQQGTAVAQLLKYLILQL